MVRSWIDLDLAAHGYLRAPDGRFRYVHGVDRIVRDAMRSGARLCWRAMDVPGCCYVWTRLIELTPELIDEEPWRIRRIMSHEVGHALYGPSEERVRAWQRREFGELVEPVDD